MGIVPPDIQGVTDWEPLARGGFATVWRARQPSLNRPVAVKVDDRTLEKESERRRFLGEAGAAGNLSGHPSIVTVYDTGILANGRPYLVMKYCSGGSLTSWLKPDEGYEAALLKFVDAILDVRRPFREAFYPVQARVAEGEFTVRVDA